MSHDPLPVRLTRAVGKSPGAEQAAAAQEFLYRPILDWARNSPFHTGFLGHSIHPPLNDLTVGCWASASLLDVAGGTDARSSANRGHHALGVALALAGNAVLAGSGFLGGHLALNRGTARRVSAD